jgi:DNA-3-methyladenine glycosylase
MDADRREDLRTGDPVEASFFERRSTAVARDLVGTHLLVDREGTDPVGGVVTETEAYVGHIDPSCHLAAGRTDRTEPFFSGPGTVYVFTIWGHHNCNVITEFRGHPEGVLVRAVEPTHGLDRLRENRSLVDPTALTTGPGRLTEAMGITKGEFDDRPLAASPLTIRRTDLEPDVAVAPRIGISDAADWPLRFCLAGSRFLSEPVPDDPDLDRGAVADAYAELAAAEQSPLDAR